MATSPIVGGRAWPDTQEKCVFYIETLFKRVLVGFCILKNMCLSVETDPPHSTI